MRAIRLAFVTAMCLSALGCGPQTESSQAPSKTVDARVSAVPSSSPRGDDRAEYLKELAAMNHLEEPLEVAIIREITPDERSTVLASCMTDAGFPPDPGTLGQWGELPSDQLAAFDTANYTCEAAYPVAEKYRRPMNREQLQMVYDYYGNGLAACVEAEGFSVPELPSFEEFLTTAGTSKEYNPWALVPVEYTETVWSHCEALPPYEELYP